MSVFVTIYGTMAWQNASAYNSAARTAHESRMGNILGRWLEFAKLLAITILALAAITFLNAPEFAAQAAGVQETLDKIGNPQIREQMRIPTALSVLLPMGIKGTLCAIVLTGIFGGDTTHLHSWGSMFVQDIILPLRKKPLEPKQHILALRLAMLGVAVFAFMFGCLFSQTEYVVMWFRITMAIYVGGAGSVIIGGLYWKKGTTAAAWAAMLTGSILSVTGIIVRQIVPGFPFNGLQTSFGSTLISIGIYIVVSLLTGKGREFNLDRMLHRGEYAVEQAVVKEHPQPSAKKFRWSKLIGIDDQYTRGDRWIACGVFGWAMLWLGILIIGCIWHWISPWPDSVWPVFWWWVGIVIPLTVAVITTLWFTWGVIRDLRIFFRSLSSERVDVNDDGSVGHES
jgi:SSS family solute:Na+ symporter